MTHEIFEADMKRNFEITSRKFEFYNLDIKLCLIRKEMLDLLYQRISRQRYSAQEAFQRRMMDTNSDDSRDQNGN